MLPSTKLINQIASKGYNIGSVFRDWVSLMLYALSKEEELYMEVMSRYRNEGEPREADLFAKAFAELQTEMRKENHDVLGGVYMEIVSNWSAKGMGQFFTPVGLCDMMADINIKDDKKPVSVADPACGSGRTLVSSAKRVHSDSWFHGIDADNVCAQMCALNFCFFNMNGYVIHGNTLSMKFYDGWITNGSAIGGAVRQMSEEEVVQYKKKYGSAIQNRQESKQLSLL
ncbi:N-6 DNA methylase [Gracilimonas sp.]|uniref:N-6 DNA methylase n=1 Tax=Gracilimonas sp. TaxID=1974203 RepID=UPI002872142F|nr:N-6 DNA methylase [Gracilimonas sp.]